MMDRKSRLTRATIRPRLTRGSMLFEPLEERRLLITSVYVNDNWVKDTDPGQPVEEGDIVKSTLDSGTTIFAEYGFDAFGIVEGTSVSGFATIREALEQTSTNGTLNILAGTYTESDIVIDKPVRIVGSSGVAKSIIIPEATSSHSTATNFATGTHSGLILYSPDVKIENVVVDGSGNTSLSGTLHYHHGITTLYDKQNGSNYSSLHNGSLAPKNLGSDANIVLQDVTVKNTWYRGITLSGTSGMTIGQVLVDNAVVENIGAGGQMDANRVGVLLQNVDDGQVSNSEVENVGVGIATRTFGTTGPTAAHSRTSVRDNLVTDAVTYGYAIENADGQLDLSYLYGVIFPHAPEYLNGFVNNSANFTTSNNAVGVYVNHSGTVILGLEVTGAKVGVQFQDNLAGSVLTPALVASTITGPGSGVSGSVGILAETTSVQSKSLKFVVGQKRGHHLGHH